MSSEKELNQRIDEIRDGLAISIAALIKTVDVNGDHINMWKSIVGDLSNQCAVDTFPGEDKIMIQQISQFLCK